MTEERSQKPTEGASRGLSPLAIGLTLGLAATGWMIAEWLRRVWP
jgi:hypothetical protein